MWSKHGRRRKGHWQGWKNEKDTEALKVKKFKRRAVTFQHPRSLDVFFLAYEAETILVRNGSGCSEKPSSHQDILTNDILPWGNRMRLSNYLEILLKIRKRHWKYP
jgi:hypothetical protein